MNVIKRKRFGLNIFTTICLIFYVAAVASLIPPNSVSPLEGTGTIPFFPVHSAIWIYFIFLVVWSIIFLVYQWKSLNSVNRYDGIKMLYDLDPPRLAILFPFALIFFGITSIILNFLDDGTPQDGIASLVISAVGVLISLFYVQLLTSQRMNDDHLISMKEKLVYQGLVGFIAGWETMIFSFLLIWVINAKTPPDFADVDYEQALYQNLTITEYGGSLSPNPSPTPLHFKTLTNALVFLFTYLIPIILALYSWLTTCYTNMLSVAFFVAFLGFHNKELYWHGILSGVLCLAFGATVILIDVLRIRPKKLNIKNGVEAIPMGSDTEDEE